MKKILLSMMAICFCILCFSQGEGVHFVHDMSWQQILAKAKTENKYIFVDCYTTWCGPCKFMSKEIFPLKETGDAVNPHYICVGIQIDSTAKDAESIKMMYRDAHFIESSYNIRAYPTFLYFNPDGQLVHRTEGSTKNAAEFISITQNALNPDGQYYTMIEKFRSGNRDTLMMESLIKLAVVNENGYLADSVIRAWLPLIKNVYTTDRLQMIAQIAIQPGSPEFDLFYHNAGKINPLFKPGFAESIVMNSVIQHNQSIMAAFNDPASPPDWNKISTEISNQYGSDLAHRIVASVKPAYYKRTKNWDLFIKSLLSFLKEYESKLDPIDLNNSAFDIFQYSSSTEDLKYALTLSERSMDSEKNNPAFIDTYANILYKLGRKAEAIAKETEALNLTEPAERPDYQQTLDKMKSGAKTWE